MRGCTEAEAGGQRRERCHHIRQVWGKQCIWGKGSKSGKRDGKSNRKIQSGTRKHNGRIRGWGMESIRPYWDKTYGWKSTDYNCQRNLRRIEKSELLRADGKG